MGAGERKKRDKGYNKVRNVKIWLFIKIVLKSFQEYFNFFFFYFFVLNQIMQSYLYNFGIVINSYTFN